MKYKKPHKVRHLKINPDNLVPLGRFSLPVELLQSAPDLLCSLFGYMVIMVAGYNARARVIAYTAWSRQLFAPIPEGSVPPLYQITLDEQTKEWIAVQVLPKVTLSPGDEPEVVKEESRIILTDA